MTFNRAKVGMRPAQMIAHLPIEAGKQIKFGILLRPVQKAQEFVRYQRAIFIQNGFNSQANGHDTTHSLLSRRRHVGRY